jgi:hypothetical protein
LGELRATAALIGSLPDPRTSRRLVPRVAAPPAWLAPLRTLSTLASGVSVFLFIGTALLANMGSLARGTAGALPAAAPAASAASSTSSEGRSASAPTATPAPVLNQAGGATAGPTALALADSAKAAATATASPAPPAAQFSTTSSTPQDAAARSEQTSTREGLNTPTPPLGTNPLLWLVLAIVTGAIAFGLQRRLRSA